MTSPNESKRPRIALLVDTHVVWGHEILRGVARFANEHGGWNIVHEPGFHPYPPLTRWLENWKGDGILGRVSRALAPHLAALPCPVVSLTPEVEAGFPVVQFDDRGIGACGAEHLLARGISHFGFLGEMHLWSKQREQGFEAVLERAGHTLSVLRVPFNREALRSEISSEVLKEWLEGLPKPAGVMACNDLFASLVLGAAGESGILVPDQLSVLGVDNDLNLCSMNEPGLTSVRAEPVQLGYRAAQALAELLAGRAVSSSVLIEPMGIAERRSTDRLAETVDEHVAAALRFIRERACAGISVDDVVEQVALSRSPLQTRFRKVLGRSIHDEIIRVRIERAKRLLADTELSIAAIADQVGIGPQSYFSVVFRTQTGVTPARFRRDSQRYELP